MGKRGKVYGQAPLPFQGQKRQWKSDFVEVIKQIPNGTTVVDLFGGSGLLSHFAKQANPTLSYIWNDFDNYQSRLDDIERTNNIMDELRRICEGLPRWQRLPQEKEEEIRTMCREYNSVAPIDYFTISRSLVFSSRAVESFDEFMKCGYYNRVKHTNYDATGYLLDVERVSKDYRELIEEHKGQGAVFLCDPPYLSTDTAQYGNDDYTGLAWHIELISRLMGEDFILFTSERSETLELVEGIKCITGVDVFADATIQNRSYGIGKHTGSTDENLINMRVEDIMVVKLSKHCTPQPYSTTPRDAYKKKLADLKEGLLKIVRRGVAYK